MITPTDTGGTPHTLHEYDNDLSHLYGLLLEVTDLLIYQFEQAMQAMDYGDAELAQKVISRHKKLKYYESKIDDGVLSVIARHCPVANDLRLVLSVSKISAEFSKIGDEIGEFARLVTVLFDPSTSDPNEKLLADIVKMGGLVKAILDKLMVVFENRDSKQAYALLQCDQLCEKELQEGIKHQLAYVLHDARMIRRALDIMQMMKILERCAEHCRVVAEHAVFMLDGVDIRHGGLLRQQMPSQGNA
ncbi:phosphate signaling complex protein PhoU [Methylomonas koyamae]|uniref:phosphate signaling complex protein PhoU n=1 Tax=Methylomonas koyamae TaxID=702114 RepID=UPI002872C7AB|nr:phosphate signaling complex protein PhoU [Methylomonas koyamae]WNB77014.1 phosphate signaling complex protein PhoU [Methylomonas koyamae]